MKINFTYFRKSNLKFYLFCIIVSLFAANKSFNFPYSLQTQYIGQTDLLLVQAHLQSITQVGPLAKTINLGYPFGFTQWSNPEFSFLQSTLVYLFQFIPTITNFGILSLINFISILLNSLSLLLVLQLFTKNNLIKFFTIFSGTSLPYVLLSFDHPHVIPFFIWNIIIYSTIKIFRNEFDFKNNFLLIISLLFTPLFWVNIILFTFFLMLIFYFIATKLNNINIIEFKAILRLVIYLIVIFVFNLILFLFHNNLNGENGRTPWQSDLFAGKFTDILLSSPLIRSFLETNSTFFELTTLDSSQNLIGLPLVIIVIIAFPFLFISNYLLKLKIEEKFLILLLQIIFFEFVVGGLSNLQATLFLIFGEASPIRAWGRLILVIPFISLYFLISFLVPKIKSRYLSIITSFLIIVYIFDLSMTKNIMKYENNVNELEEIKAINFIEKSLKPCPILQLPIDTYFIPQSAQDKGYRYYWNGKIPYLLLPEFKWTSSVYVGSKGWKSSLNIPTEMDKNYLLKIRKDYCAILFDSNFSQYQIDRKASLSNEKLIWPGLILSDEIVVDYSDTRFKVILLNKI